MQLDTVLVLLGKLLQQVSKDKKSAQVAREKAVTVLVAGDLTQECAPKLLGIKKEKVVKAIKSINL